MTGFTSLPGVGYDMPLQFVGHPLRDPPNDFDRMFTVPVDEIAVAMP